MLKPSGLSRALTTVIVRLTPRIRSRVSTSSRSSSPPLCTTGATIACPALYGNLFNITTAPSGRHTTSSASLSSGCSMTRQHKQPGRGSSVRYSMRHGAHSRFIDLRPLLARGDGGLGLDFRTGQERDHTVSDAALPGAALSARGAFFGGAGLAPGPPPGAPGA